jgi:hypothetical protein
LFGVRRFDPQQGGTRFRLLPVPPSPGSVPELEKVAVSSPVGSVGPGPSDARMFVIDPIGDKPPYGMNRGPHGTPYLYFPPWAGPVRPPAMPGPDGHFDHFEPGTPEFALAHLFGCVRFTLDVWEGYFGRPIPWFFAPRYERLEIVSLPRFDNAHTGLGFLEAGHYVNDRGETVLLELSSDIIAHEVGHLIIYAMVGQPTDATAVGEYYGFHESAADLVALITAAHFDCVIDSLFESTRGNLYVLNNLNRIGEVSDNDQIREAANTRHLAEFAAGWTKEHQLSLPLTGAMFDILVDIFHELLVERDLISPEMEDLADVVEQQPEYEGLIQGMFDDVYARDPGGFRGALLDARDCLGLYLALTWQRLSPHSLNYIDVAAALLQVDRECSGGRFARLIRRNCELRGIGLVTVGPRLMPPGADSHAFSARALVPELAMHLPPMPYRERWQVAARRHVVLP